MKKIVTRHISFLFLVVVFVCLGKMPVAALDQGSATTSLFTGNELASESLVTELNVNGLKVLVKKREGSQTIVVGLFIKGGARNISAGNAGVEALMLDSASEASTRFPRAVMRKELSRLGSTITYGLNYDYSVLTLGSTRINFDRSWQIFTDAALRPTFAKDDVERVRNRLLVSLRDETAVPDSYLQLLQARVAYTGHPYLNDPRGTAANITKLSISDLRQHHEKVMQTSRLLLVVVGDIDSEQLRKRVLSTFGKLPRGDYKPLPVPKLSFQQSSVEVTARALPTNYVQGVFAAPSLTDRDIYPLRIASSVLQSRVFVEVRYRRNLSYAPDAFLGSQEANIGGIYVTAVDANQAVRVMLDEIARLQNEPLDQQEIDSTVQHFLTRYYIGQQSNAAQAGELAQSELIGGGWRHSLLFIDRLREATPADVQRVARAYMRNLRFVVIGDPESIDTGIFTRQSAGQ